MPYSGYKTVVVKDENEDVIFTTHNLEDAISYATAYYYAKERSEFDKVLVTDIADSTAVFWSSEELTRVEHLISESASVYFDMDGTLCRWHPDGKGLSYPDEILDPRNHYYRDLEPYAFTVDLARTLVQKGADVCVISAADVGSRYDKKAWLKEHCPFIPEENIFFCPIGADKTQYIKGNADHSVLIDDYNPNLQDWQRHGGTPIKLLNSVNSVNPAYRHLNANPFDSKTNSERNWATLLQREARAIMRTNVEDAAYYYYCLGARLRGVHKEELPTKEHFLTVEFFEPQTIMFLSKEEDHTFLSKLEQYFALPLSQPLNDRDGKTERASRYGGDVLYFLRTAELSLPASLEELNQALVDHGFSPIETTSKENAKETHKASELADR